MGPLGKCLNDEYSEEEWNDFCKNYDFHKLTYKIQLQKVTPEGKKTFYGHILEEFWVFHLYNQSPFLIKQKRIKSLQNQEHNLLIYCI